jgi:hypothetical protein
MFIFGCNLTSSQPSEVRMTAIQAADVVARHIESSGSTGLLGYISADASRGLRDDGLSTRWEIEVVDASSPEYTLFTVSYGKTAMSFGGGKYSGDRPLSSLNPAGYEGHLSRFIDSPKAIERANSEGGRSFVDVDGGSLQRVLLLPRTSRRPPTWVVVFSRAQSGSSIQASYIVEVDALTGAVLHSRRQ